MGDPPGHQLSREDADRVIADIEDGRQTSAEAPVVARPIVRRRGQGAPVRPGHENAVRMLENVNAYRATREVYRQVVGEHGVYLRPVNKRLTVLNLDHETDGAMVGVGADGSEYLTSLPVSLAQAQAAHADYQKKVGDKTYKPEERYALHLISRALDSDLEIEGLPGVYFVHQEWRFPTGEKLDVLGYDPVESQLVVLELKSTKKKAETPESAKGGRNAAQQAEYYADMLFEDRISYYPFFRKLASVMAALHGGPARMVDAKLDMAKRPRTAVAWPTGQV